MEPSTTAPAAKRRRIDNIIAAVLLAVIVSAGSISIYAWWHARHFACGAPINGVQVCTDPTKLDPANR